MPGTADWEWKGGGGLQQIERKMGSKREVKLGLKTRYCFCNQSICRSSKRADFGGLGSHSYFAIHKTHIVQAFHVSIPTYKLAKKWLEVTLDCIKT